VVAGIVNSKLQKQAEDKVWEKEPNKSS
jgi:hypothetical protein